MTRKEKAEVIIRLKTGNKTRKIPEMRKFRNHRFLVVWPGLIEFKTEKQIKCVINTTCKVYDLDLKFIQHYQEIEVEVLPVQLRFRRKRELPVDK